MLLPQEMLGHQVMSPALKEREASEHPPTADVDVHRRQPPDEESSEIRWSSTMKATIDEHARPKLDSLWDFQPVEIAEVWNDIV
jgi:hypothetical protein